LGCKLKAYDETGKEVIGSLGEMVIEAPMPSMPIFFWNDPEGQRYRDSYFATYPGIWRHGDWIQINSNGSLVIYGRSDATLNRKGVRIGTAEIYAILNSIPEIEDSMILNLELPDGGDHMPLFVVLRAGARLDDALRKQINTELRHQGSPRHVPDEITAVAGIPYTLSGKKMEVPVKKLLMGMSDAKSVNPDTVRNPEALQFFAAWAKK
jgi:acetoacetyl-CoA synthetase